MPRGGGGGGAVFKRWDGKFLKEKIIRKIIYNKCNIYLILKRYYYIRIIHKP